MIQAFPINIGKVVAYSCKLVVAVLDRLFSMRVPRAEAIDVYAGRVALCEEYDTEIHYIGTPARYNSVRLLPVAIMCMIPPALCLAGAVYWTIAGRLFWVLIALVLGAVSSTVLLPVFRTEYRRHVRRVFTVTDTSLLSESPVDNCWKAIDRLHYLRVQEHADGTVTITCASKYSGGKGLHDQLRRLDTEEAEKVVSLLQRLSGGSVEVIVDGSEYHRGGVFARQRWLPLSAI